MSEDNKKRLGKVTSLKKKKNHEGPVSEAKKPHKADQVVQEVPDLPKEIAILPVAQTTMFPGMVVPVILPEGKLTEALEEVAVRGGYLGIAVTKNGHGKHVAKGSSSTMTGLPVEGTEPSEERVIPSDDAVELHKFGVVAKVIKKINLPDNQVSLLLSGVQRFKVKKVISNEVLHISEVTYLQDVLVKNNELEALLRSALGQFKQLSKDNPLISEEIRVALVNIDGPSKLTDLMASVLVRDIETYQKFLSLNDVKERLHQLLLLLKKETDVQSVQRRIQDEINEKVTSVQRDYYLQEQLKAIQKELGRGGDEKNRILEKFKQRLEGKDVPKEALTRIEEEFEKIETIHEQSSEFSVSINYLDWVTALPWGVRTEENFDLQKADRILNRHHYSLQDVKDRVLEFLAVKKLKMTSEGSIICFVGPPGTGKTSLGKSIAQALNRKFHRFSVGGMRDEAEIKGHRRTYVGAMPGKIVQGLKRMGAQNPVFLIDEIDKMGNSFASGGDPSSALLEALDPEQNKEFLDHFVDLPVDLSEVLFITTANTLDTIPGALLDRMEVIRLHGYSDPEKIKIARRHLIPKQIEKNGLKKSQIVIGTEALKYIITHYARESGVRNLEKQLARVCRKSAYHIAMKKVRKVNIDTPKKIEKLLGPPPFAPEVVLGHQLPGLVTGLAWTQYGGEVLYVESSYSEGKGTMTLTGSLGDVMKESASLSYTYVRDKAVDIGLTKDFFDKHNIHLHVPAGATPKDGPSAGVTMATSLISLLTKQPVRSSVAMTGELTLSGRILPVGGIKEKLLASKRNHCKTVLIPKENARDLDEISADIKRGLKIIPVATMKELAVHAFRSKSLKL